MTDTHSFVHLLLALAAVLLTTRALSVVALIRLDIRRPRLPIERHVRGNPHRHAGLELRRLGGTLLPERHAAVRIPHRLRASVRFGGSGLDVLCVPGGGDDPELGLSLI